MAVRSQEGRCGGPGYKGLSCKRELNRRVRPGENEVKLQAKWKPPDATDRGTTPARTSPRLCRMAQSGRSRGELRRPLWLEDGETSRKWMRRVIQKTPKRSQGLSIG